MAAPALSMATRSRLVSSLRLKIEYTRPVTLAGAMTNARAATRGSSATSRKSFTSSSTPTPAQVPTQALRVSVSATAATSAGSTRAGQTRSRRSNSSRAEVAVMMSISRPEYVIQCPRKPSGRLPSVSNAKTPYWITPTTALIAPMVMATLSTRPARRSTATA